ncbi:MAG: UDP-glucose 4-epimerase GalE [Rhodospirillales bacterium]|nr:UDP-glucose 4-epimerase GalE [Rhodospirillales bacterium]
MTPSKTGDRSTVLVVGGAGYVGSHTVWALHDAGIRVVVLDDLSTGERRLLPPKVPLIVGKAGDRSVVRRVLADHACDAVMHFAASILAGESVTDPAPYFANNTGSTLGLLAACADAGIGLLVYSSTAAVYGEPVAQPISEDAPLVPINPYGQTKLAGEWMIRDTARLSGLRYVALRYFNVAGADPQGRTGPVVKNPTHLVRRACQAAVWTLPGLEVYGTDYPTPDGTCIRDYVHASDIADAHVAALRHLRAGGESVALNCGYGRGASVREVVTAMETEAGIRLKVRDAPRRPGDPSQLVADARRIRSVLGWTPRFDDLNQIVRTGLAWERTLTGRA